MPFPEKSETRISILEKCLCYHRYRKFNQHESQQKSKAFDTSIISLFPRDQTLCSVIIKHDINKKERCSVPKPRTNQSSDCRLVTFRTDLTNLVALARIIWKEQVRYHVCLTKYRYDSIELYWINIRRQVLFLKVM